MSKLKQVIVVRTDLNMRKGKLAAQCCHSAMKVILDDRQISDKYMMNVRITAAMKEWLESAFTKVVLGVDSEEAIYELARKAKEANIPHAVIVDNGFTEFHGNKTTTCIAIGPDESDKIDLLTGDLKLI